MDSRFTRWRALFIAQQFRDPALTAPVAISGSGSVSVSVSAFNAVGTERNRGSGSGSFAVASVDASGTIRDEESTGNVSIGVPVITGTGTQHVGGGGSHYTVNPSRFVVERLPKLEIPGTGQIEFPCSAVTGNGKQALMAVGGVLFESPSNAAFGSQSIAGRGRIAHRHSSTGAGIHDMTPIEEEEYALLMAA